MRRTMVRALVRWKDRVVDYNQVPGSSRDTVPPGREQRAHVILVIDDEAMIVDMVRDLLIMVGYTVLVAAHDEAGLAQALAAHPDLIVTDVMMPGMDGHDLCRRLRADARTATIPVIAMSAAYRPQADAAFDAVIAKPFDIPPFLAVIEAQLGRRPQSVPGSVRLERCSDIR